jgi:hypothetical protein
LKKYLYQKTLIRTRNSPISEKKMTIKINVYQYFESKYVASPIYSKKKLTIKINVYQYFESKYVASPIYWEKKLTIKI